MNILFVCRGNLQRSPTAEEMVEGCVGELDVRSAGIFPTASNRVDEELLEWADRVYVMTERIENSLQSDFPELFEKCTYRVLGIPDRYRKGEERLKRRLREEFSKDEILSQYFE